MMAWRRPSLGKANEVWQARGMGATSETGPVPFRRDIYTISADEFEADLRRDGASESMIDKELRVLRQIQEEYHKVVPTVDYRRESRKSQPVEKALEIYASARQRVRSKRNKEKTDATES